MVLAGGGGICAAFSEKEMCQGLDLGIGDRCTNGAAALTLLPDQSSGVQHFEVVGQGGTSDTRAFAKFANAQPVRPRTHKAAQDGKALFGPKRGKAGSGKGKRRKGLRFCFHISRNIEMSVVRKYYFDSSRNDKPM